MKVLGRNWRSKLCQKWEGSTRDKTRGKITKLTKNHSVKQELDFTVPESLFSVQGQVSAAGSQESLSDGISARWSRERDGLKSRVSSANGTRF